MGIRRFKPTTNGIRHAALVDFAELTKHKPEKALLEPLKQSGGRNNNGRITSRRKGGGHKRMYRLVDFTRARLDDQAVVLGIEYDPNRTSRIALIEYQSDKTKSYILAPVDLRVGDNVVSTNADNADIKTGNALLLGKIPLGTAVHNVELKPGRGGKLARSAGTSVQLIAKEGEYAHLRMPSSEVRMVPLLCRATIGQLSNPEHGTQSIGKAGRNRWKGKRPISRGVVRNPVDHPHGGGEGKHPQGNPHPVSPWGQKSKGLKTRNRRKYSNNFILKRRTK
jgi:large subunit ribosomal protein L2